MLNNPQWDKTVHLTAFIDWLRQQPDKTYDWGSGEACLMAQYLQATHPHEAEPPMPSWYTTVTQTRPWTIGDALKRAEAVNV